MSGRILSNHYRKLRLCLGFQALPRAFYRALDNEILCRASHSAQKHSRHYILCGRPGRRQAGTLGKITSLSRASPRHGGRRRRRSERRHIWVAVHCADGSAVRPSAQMPPVLRASSSALGKGVDPGLPPLTDLCREQVGAVGREDVCADGPLSAQGLCRGPHQALGKEVIFFSFWVELISLLKVH
jgi:hypothetical protein